MMSESSDIEKSPNVSSRLLQWQRDHALNWIHQLRRNLKKTRLAAHPRRHSGARGARARIQPAARLEARRIPGSMLRIGPE
jgi:hypothetical protein